MGLQVTDIYWSYQIKMLYGQIKNGKMENQKTRIRKKKLNGIPKFKNTIIEIKMITKDSLKCRTGPSRRKKIVNCNI